MRSQGSDWYDTQMATSLKLISLNIERHKHLDLVEKFLAEHKPDVVCLQELMQEDIERLANAAGTAVTVFEPMGKLLEESKGTMGVGIFSKIPFVSTRALYYVGNPSTNHESFSWKDPETFNDWNRIVLSAEVEKDNSLYSILTTHFTWTPGGEVNNLQREHIASLLVLLKDIPQFVFCGDFNAPRGGEIFGMLAARYKDNVPPQYKTSIDASLHRAGKTRPEELADKMVDGIFSTSTYVVSDVEMVCGVSDHCALVANVSGAT